MVVKIVRIKIMCWVLEFCGRFFFFCNPTCVPGPGNLIEHACTYADPFSCFRYC